MLEIKKQYVVDEHNRKVAVQMSIETFQQIEQLLEDYVLAQKMIEVEAEPALDLASAKQQYRLLES